MPNNGTDGAAGFEAVTPYLVVRGAADAIEFYKRAFGAEEVMRMPGPDGLLMHAEIQLGDFRVMLTDEMPAFGSQSPQSLNGTPVTIHLQVADCDATFARAAEAGCQPVMPPADMFWGDRFGRLVDPYGHSWSIATHQRDVSMEEMQEGLKAALAAQQESK